MTYCACKDRPLEHWETCIFCPVREAARDVADILCPPPRVWFWTSDFGDIRLPADFPIEIFRKDGWWDMRFTALREKWQAWIATEEAKLRGPIPEAPNRLHGAAINAEGDAI